MRRSRQTFFYHIPGFPPSGKNSLTVSCRWGTFAGDVLHGGFIELIAFDGAYLDESLLRLSIIVSDQVGTSKVELLWGILQDGGQLRYQLGKVDSLPYLVLSYTEKFCNQGLGRILLAILARSFVISIRAIPLPVFCIQQSLIRLTTSRSPVSCWTRMNPAWISV